MERVFLQHSTSKLSLRAGQLIQTEQDGSETAHPICATELVEVYGNAQITTQAVKECLKEGVRINYFTIHGKYLGRLEPGYPKNTRRRMEQCHLYYDTQRRLSWCKALQVAKVRGELVELRRQKEHGLIFPYEEIREELRGRMDEIEEATSVEELLGIEGQCAREYYRMFPYILPEGVEWCGRSYHPAQDGVNEILSCVYGILAQCFREETEHWSLDPHCGFLHEPRYGGAGLTYDLLEIQRATVGDHLAFRLIRGNEELQEVARKKEAGHLNDKLYRPLASRVREALGKSYHRQKWTPQEQMQKIVEMTVKSLEGDGEAPDYKAMQPER